MWTGSVSGISSWGMHRDSRFAADPHMGELPLIDPELRHASGVRVRRGSVGRTLQRGWRAIPPTGQPRLTAQTAQAVRRDAHHGCAPAGWERGRTAGTALRGSTCARRPCSGIALAPDRPAHPRHTFLQPAPGTSVDRPSRQRARTAGAARPRRVRLSTPAQRRRPRRCWRWPSACSAITIGVDAVHYTRELGLSSDDVTGFLSIAAGLGPDRPRRASTCGARAAPTAGATRAASLYVRRPLLRVRVRRRPGRAGLRRHQGRRARSCPPTTSASRTRT